MSDALREVPATSQPQPDPRVLQANERTLLAWIRTGLGVMAFGFVIARLGVWLRAMQPENARGGRSVYFGVAIILLSAGALVTSAARSKRNHEAILRHEPLVHGQTPALLLAIGLAVVGMGLALYLVLL